MNKLFMKTVIDVASVIRKQPVVPSFVSSTTAVLCQQFWDNFLQLKAFEKRWKMLFLLL